MLKRKGQLFASALLAAAILAGCSGDNAADKSEETKTEEPVIVVLGDTVNSHLQKDAVCVVDSRFERGHTIVFHANVIDQKTEKTVEDAKVKLVLGTGEEMDMKLGPHGEEGTLLYTVSWTVPDDFPTGTLDYQIVAEVDGKEYAYEPFNVGVSKLTILEAGAEAKLAAQAQAAPQSEEAQ